MRFKTDGNLPAEVAELLRGKGPHTFSPPHRVARNGLFIPNALAGLTGSGRGGKPPLREVDRD
jgi:hypothetical protein